MQSLLPVLRQEPKVTLIDVWKCFSLSIVSAGSLTGNQAGIPVLFGTFLATTAMMPLSWHGEESP